MPSFTTTCNTAPFSDESLDSAAITASSIAWSELETTTAVPPPMSGALDVTAAPTIPPPPTTFCDGVVTTALELGTVLRFAAPLNVEVPVVGVLPKALVVLVVSPPPVVVVVPVAFGVVVMVPDGETDIVPL